MLKNFSTDFEDNCFRKYEGSLASRMNHGRKYTKYNLPQADIAHLSRISSQSEVLRCRYSRELVDVHYN